MYSHTRQCGSLLALFYFVHSNSGKDMSDATMVVFNPNDFAF